MKRGKTLAAVLDQALKDGAVHMRRRNGTTFTIKPMKAFGFPLDVGYFDIALTRDEAVATVREGREHLSNRGHRRGE